MSYAPGMRTPEVSPSGSRETRLLLVTIAISVGVLLLLARFRFPGDAATQTVESAPAPLERLAARASYDELASIMADLERRVTPRVTVARIQNAGSSSLAIVPRVLPDRAVALVRPGDHAPTITAANHEPINLDLSSGIAVMRVPAIDDSAVAIRPGGLARSGPRYVVLVEATAVGPALRPLFVGRIDAVEDPRTGTTLLTLAGHEGQVPAGSAVFSLEASFIGLVRDSGNPATVVPAEFLRTFAREAQPSAGPLNGDLGIEVDGLTPALAGATGTEQGVIVVHVRAGGPSDGALRTGDVVQSVDGAAVASAVAFRELERSRTPGADVTITAVRARSPLQVTVKAADVSAGTTEAADPGLVGRNVPGVGIEVVTVREGSAAHRAGLARGDLIVAVDGEQAPDTTSFARRFRGDGAVTALVTVQRGAEHRVLVVERR